MVQPRYNGAMLPLGGIEVGHKGYALGLLGEALTGGLAGHGRADPVEGWAANVLVQILDPACFGGEEDFRRQMHWLAEACRAAPPRPGFDHVRLPGEEALARRAVQLQRGIALHPSAVAGLRPWSEKLHVAFPQPQQ